jgi:hypothetical protein
MVKRTHSDKFVGWEFTSNDLVERNKQPLLNALISAMSEGSLHLYWPAPDHIQSLKKSEIRKVCPGVRFINDRIFSNSEINSDDQQHNGYQATRACASLKRLYPNGVPGRDVIKTAPLQRQVAKDLRDDSRQKGLRAPSWQVVDLVRDDC